MALKLKELGHAAKVLIICPATVKDVWAREIEKHTGERVLVVNGTKKKRQEIFQQFRSNLEIMFLVANYENVRVDKEEYLK